MTTPPQEPSLRDRLRRVDALLQGIEQYQDPQARQATQEIVRTLMELHGSALERLLSALAEKGEAGLAAIDEAARDPLVSSVLLLYGLHPLGIEARVKQALEGVRQQLQASGATAELLGTTGNAVRVRLHGGGKDGLILKQAVEEALTEWAPDATAVEVVAELSAEAGVALPVFPPVGRHG